MSKWALLLPLQPRIRDQMLVQEPLHQLLRSASCLRCRPEIIRLRVALQPPTTQMQPSLPPCATSYRMRLFPAHQLPLAHHHRLLHRNPRPVPTPSRQQEPRPTYPTAARPAPLQLASESLFLRLYPNTPLPIHPPHLQTSQNAPFLRLRRPQRRCSVRPLSLTFFLRCRLTSFITLAVPVIPAARPANLNAPPTQHIPPPDDAQLVASASSIPPWNRSSLFEGSVAIRALHKSNYSQRYCVVTPAAVYIFKAPSDKDRSGVVPSGVVPLRDIELARVNNRTLRLSSPSSSAGIIIVTNNDSEFEEWMSMLTNCIRSLRAAASPAVVQSTAQTSEAVEELRWQQATESRKLEKRNNRTQIRVEDLERALASERARAERLEATLRMVMERMASLEERLNNK